MAPLLYLQQESKNFMQKKGLIMSQKDAKNVEQKEVHKKETITTDLENLIVK